MRASRKASRAAGDPVRGGPGGGSILGARFNSSGGSSIGPTPMGFFPRAIRAGGPAPGGGSVGTPDEVAGSVRASRKASRAAGDPVRGARSPESSGSARFAGLLPPDPEVVALDGRGLSPSVAAALAARSPSSSSPLRAARAAALVSPAFASLLAERSDPS